MSLLQPGFLPSDSVLFWCCMNYCFTRLDEMFFDSISAAIEWFGAWFGCVPAGKF